MPVSRILEEDISVRPSGEAGFGKPRSGYLGALVAVWLAVLAPSPALAQTSAPALPANLLSPAIAPDQSSAIPLSKATGAAAQAEQWENFHGELAVRNV